MTSTPISVGRYSGGGAAEERNGLITYSLNSLASTNAALLKSRAGVVYSFTIHNASGLTRYVRLYDLAVAPTVGTSVPIVVVAVPTGQSKEFSSDSGIQFSNGIGIAITGSVAVNDATAVSAGDLQLTISYV